MICSDPHSTPTKSTFKTTMDNTPQSPQQLYVKVNNKTRTKRRRYSKKNPKLNGGVDGDAKSANDATSEPCGDNEASTVGSFPYPTDYNDHFETPARAYNDIFPLMEFILAKKMKMKAHPPNGNRVGCHKSAIVYDPYYCAGRAAILLRKVFQRQNSRKSSMPIHIHHEKTDFYRDIQQNTVPPYDILVTNPPYSEDHKERCLEFAVNQLKNHGRPFCLLLPNYVATKEYYRKIVLGDRGNTESKKVQTFYITPSSNHPYEYDHPDGTGHAVSPFASVWFCGLSCEGEMDTKDAVDKFVKFHSLRAPSPTGTPKIVTTLQELIQIGCVSGARRKNPRQRKKMRSQAIERTNAGAIVGSGQNSICKKRKLL